MADADRNPGAPSHARHGAPPQAAALIYAGQVMHQRMKPVGHRFSYSVFSLMIDLDRLDEAGTLSTLFSINRFNLLSFYETDHTGGGDRSLRAYADELLSDAGITSRAARILLVCYPRILGYVFNPIAIYHAYDIDNVPVAVIYEVRNTFGQRHTYVCPVGAGDLSPSGIRQECDKIFHVSPFVAMTMRYRFRILPPGRDIRWRILEMDGTDPLLAATFSGVARPVTTSVIVKLTARIPHLTIKIVAGIHWEALKLWVKGLRYIPKPAAPVPVSVWSGGKRVSLARPPSSSEGKRARNSVVGEPAE